MQHDERRRFRRVEVKIPAIIRVKEKPHMIIKAEVLNISEGGALLSCELPVGTIGQELLIEINFGESEFFQSRVTETDDVEVYIEGPDNCIIQWASPGRRGNIGVQFLGLPPEKRKFIADLVAKLLPHTDGDFEQIL